MKNILIIDDTKTNIDLLLEFLTEYNLFVATDGKSGLEILNENDIDLVLLDIMMPEIDGYEVCKIIRNTPKIKDIPIIFLTAKTQEEDIEKAYEVGGNDYVTKPFKQKELLARIKMQLKIKNHNKILEELIIQKSKMAQMGEMIDSIAHQWKQPINVISLYIQLLEMDFYEGVEFDENYILNIKNNVNMQIEHLIETLDEFRGFFRDTDNITNFDVKHTLDKVSLLIKDDIQKYHIKLEIEEISPYILNGNENEFKHIFINLINNAKDAFIEKELKNREIFIKIDGNNKEIKIKDNGGGINQDILDKIFEMNYTTKQSGTGMGLYMSQKIANKLGGKLCVHNTDNGVEFVFKG